MKEARFYEKFEKRKIKCFLCAHNCLILEGRRGICGVRENREGVLYSLVYGKLIAMNIDPIEKKPLFHFYPASTSYSISTVGCNFRCKHCQNYDISQYPKIHNEIPGESIPPEQVVAAAERTGCKSISYTYTEPTIFLEFAYDCARIAHERGIKNVFVSNGYTGPEAVKAIAPYLDGNNIDLKGDDEFYKKICGARVQPVLDTIKLMKELGVWVEVTTLVIPAYNDSEKTINDIIDFILSVDPAIPWHVSQFYPTYQLMDCPRTPVETLKKIRDMGMRKGLKYVYTGNIPGERGENTLCPKCGEVLIERLGYRIAYNKIQDGACYKCKTKIEGVWG
ncbi:MAG: AmmeMemoRadiSam system radical SAM enzyme [Nitrospiraceae bacterium]|nr:MAG: AmmeMemoRadiSam system radical SAM enzyme [Nitrospiraceae bacterium]